MIPTLRFLEMLHGKEVTGFIEVRLIEEKTEEMKAAKRKPKVVKVGWYLCPQALMSDLESLLEKAREHNAAIFFGVLRRRARGKGKAEDVLPGSVVWVDLDAKDFPDGMDGVRRKLAELPLSPSIVVHSAHGLHAYWLLREEHAPAELSAVSQRLARALNGDSAFDAARILRLPGTYNRKDPANPTLVTIERLEAEPRYNLSELADALDMLGRSEPERQEPGDAEPVQKPRDRPIRIGDGPSQRVLSLIAMDPRVHCYFHGRGKRVKDENGRQLDASSSGYDFSLAMSLIANGITDPNEIGTAIWHRPDGGARGKREGYVALTVRNALARFQNDSSSPAPTAGCNVEHVTIYDSIPPQYMFVIDGVELKLTANDLQSPARFELRHLEALQRVPNLPRKRAQWGQLVNSWLAKAERVEMPPDASEDGALREAVLRAIEGLQTGDNALDLDRGLAMRAQDGRLTFKTEAVFCTVRVDHPEAQRGAVCRVLRELSYESLTLQFPTKKVRVWTHKELPEARAREES